MKASAAALLVAFAIAGPALADSLIDRTEVGVSIGGLATDFVYRDGSTPQFLGYAAVQAHSRFFRWLAVDGWAEATPAFAPGQAMSSYTLGLRAGVDFFHWGVVAGPAFNFAPGSPTLVQTLPSLTAWVGFARWRVVFGLLDRPELLASVARLGFEYDWFGVALTLVGAEVTGRFWIADHLAVDARLSANMLLYEASLATVGVTWIPGGRP